MFSNRRALLTIFLTAATASTLIVTGCGDDKGSSPAKRPTPTPTPTKTTVVTEFHSTRDVGYLRSQTSVSQSNDSAFRVDDPIAETQVAEQDSEPLNKVNNNISSTSRPYISYTVNNEDLSDEVVLKALSNNVNISGQTITVKKQCNEESAKVAMMYDGVPLGYLEYDVVPSSKLSYEFSQTSVTLSPGETTTLSLDALYNKQTLIDQDAVVASDNSKVTAKLDGNTVTVTASDNASAGSVNVTASVDGTKVATCQVTIQAD